MDSFFDKNRQLSVLLEQYERHGKIIVAFDFDDTVKPFRGEKCYNVIQLIRDLRPYAHLICFTARTPENQTEAERFLKENYIPFDYINREWTGKKIEGKLFYNQLLDDKAGLYESYTILKEFFNIVDGKVRRERAIKIMSLIFYAEKHSGILVGRELWKRLPSDCTFSVKDNDNNIHNIFFCQYRSHHSAYVYGEEFTEYCVYIWCTSLDLELKCMRMEGGGEPDGFSSNYPPPLLDKVLTLMVQYVCDSDGYDYLSSAKAEYERLMTYRKKP